MFRHLPYRLTTVNQAILAIFLGLGFSVPAHAVQLGQASVQSEQHEPLAATILVSNIDANHFSASIAPSSMYEQLGLNKSTPVSVTFERTSENSGKIILKSSEPVSAPFTDIVLNLNNNGEQYIEPQTLLMPLPKAHNVAKPIQATPVLAADVSPNLPIVNESPAIIGNALTVQMTAPPPLFDETTKEIEQSTLETSDIFANDNASIDTQTSTPITAQIIDEKERVLSSIVPEGTNTQINILTEQITRRIFPVGSSGLIDAPSKTKEQETKTPLQSEAEVETQPSTNASYLVQSGDNLWSIANQIAIANNLAVPEVMKALHSQNPDAFVGGKANQLKANVSLAIPNYEVIPSQKAIQESISAKKRSSKPNKAEDANTRSKTSTSKASTTRPQTIKPIPKPQVTLVTPTQNGQATGGQARTTNNTGSAGAGDQLTTTLKNTRTQTAQNAKRVNSLNQELSSATQRLQLQNQKLAELEARLKALKDK